MRIKPLRLAIVSILLPILTACQTQKNGSSTDVFEAVKPLNETADELKKAFCAGQTPQEVPKEIYDTLDDFTKQYIRRNNNQFLEAGCKV